MQRKVPAHLGLYLAMPLAIAMAAVFFLPWFELGARVPAAFCKRFQVAPERQVASATGLQATMGKVSQTEKAQAEADTRGIQRRPWLALGVIVPLLMLIASVVGLLRRTPLRVASGLLAALALAGLATFFLALTVSYVNWEGWLGQQAREGLRQFSESTKVAGRETVSIWRGLLRTTPTVWLWLWLGADICVLACGVYAMVVPASICTGRRASDAMLLNGLEPSGDPPPVAQPAERDRGFATRVSMPLAVIAGLFFFLPWVDVTCINSRVASASGLQMSRGQFSEAAAFRGVGDLPTSQPAGQSGPVRELIRPRPWFFLGLGVPVAALLIAMVALKWGDRHSAPLGAAMAVLGLAGILTMVLAANVDYKVHKLVLDLSDKSEADTAQEADDAESVGRVMIKTNATGFVWASLACYVGIAGCGLANLLRQRLSNVVGRSAAFAGCAGCCPTSGP